jgi:predicted AlkP superfamily phosphohydrolase/phosphomutase
MLNETKTLLVGLDGIGFDILETMRADGRIPNIARLMDEGASGVLRSTYPPITGTAWCSFMTGRNPGKHGVYAFMRRTRGSYLWEPCSYSSIRMKTMWEDLCAAGKRVGVVNMPMTFPPKISNGVMIAGMNAPSERAQISDPPELKGRLNEMAGGYRLDVSWADYLGEGGTKEGLLDALIGLTEQRTRVCRELIGDGAFDVFAVVYVAMDRVQHTLWEYLGVEGPKPEDEEGWRISNLCGQVYAAVDEGVGQLVGAFGEGADVILMSDHGFGPLTGWADVNEVLAHHGLLAEKTRNSVREGMVRIAHKLGISPHTVRRVAKSLGLGRAAEKAIESAGGSIGRYDMPRTKAYCYMHNDLHVNLAARDPQGVVEPEEYDAVRQQVIDVLLNLRDERTGEPLVMEVSRREDIYSGEMTDLMPDMVITQHKPGHMLSGMVYRPSDDAITRRDLHHGVHTMDGVYIACGPNFRSKAKADDARIIDVCPTILAAHGVPLSTDIDGRPLLETMAERFSEPGAILTTEEAGARVPDADEAISDEEKEEMAERLRGLGYME